MMATMIAPFVPGHPGVRHPRRFLDFAALPATGRYVPSVHWLPRDLEIDGEEYRCVLADLEGQIAATVVGAGHTLPEVMLHGAEGHHLAEICVGMRSLGECVPHMPVETVAQHLVAEWALAGWCEAAASGGLLWCTEDGAGSGEWQLEPLLSGDSPGDVAALAGMVPDALYVWSGGTRVPVRANDRRARFIDRTYRHTF